MDTQGVTTEGDRPPSEFQPPSRSGTGYGPITRADRMRAQITELEGQANAARQRVAQLSQPNPEETPRGSLPEDIESARQVRANRINALNAARAEVTRLEAEGRKIATDLANDPDVGDKPIEIGGRILKPDGKGGYTVVWEPPTTTRPTRAITAPELGSTVELNALEDEAQQFIDGLYADASLTDAERSRRYQAWRETVFNPKVQKAVDDAKAKAAAAEGRAQQASDIAQQTATRQQTTAERTAQTAAEQLALDTRKFIYGAGQDAVKNALALLPYSAGPSISPDIAGIYNSVLNAPGWRSGGSISGGAFSFPTPNLDALADAGVRRAMAMAGSTALPRTAGTVVPAAPSPAVAAQVAQTPAALPPPRAGAAQPVVPVMPDQPWWRPGDLSGTGAPAAY